MTSLSRWIASLPLTPLAVLTLQGVVPNAQAFTDSNAELKEAQASRRVLPTAPAAKPPVRAAWVPTSPKRLDSFKPVLPPEPEALRVAKAETAASARR